MPDALIQKPAI